MLSMHRTTGAAVLKACAAAFLPKAAPRGAIRQVLLYFRRLCFPEA